MATLTHCPNCTYSVGPRDTKCPRCGTPIQRHSTGTVALTRPVQAFFDIAVGGRGTARNVPLLDHIPMYTIGRAPGQGANAIGVDNSASAVAGFHARLHLDNRDPTISLWRFEDLGSPNGSYRNYQRVMHPVTLDDGDEIWLGPVGGPTSVRLIYHDPVDRPPVKRWLLHPGGHNPLKIGRNVGAGHLRLFGENASDHHATINKVTTSTSTTYELVDEGSSNGTFVNDVQLSAGQSVALKHDDHVRFGKAQYSVRTIDASRMIMVPQGVQATEHIVGQGLYRTVSIETNMWLSQYVRYSLRSTLNPGAGQQYGATLTPPQREKTLLQDVDIVVGPNDFVVLAGSSGSGKSTLMHILSTFIYPQAGALYYKGQDYKDYPQLLRPNMGYVPQDDIVHEQLTVFEELLYAAELRLPPTLTSEDREARVHAVLKQLRLVPQTRQRINRLSGGQRKRVSIAVELLNRPGVLFLDEPTEGQDLALEQSLIIMLRNLANDGTSIVLISHRLNFLDYADYVGWLAPGGHLVYFGPPDQVGEYFKVNADLSLAQRYAAVYDKLDQSVDPIRLAQEFKRSAHYQEFIQMRRQYGAALGTQTGPLSTGMVPTQSVAQTRAMPGMPPPIQPRPGLAANMPITPAQGLQRPTLPPMPGVANPQVSSALPPTPPIPGLQTHPSSPIQQSTNTSSTPAPVPQPAPASSQSPSIPPAPPPPTPYGAPTSGLNPAPSQGMSPAPQPMAQGASSQASQPLPPPPQAPGSASSVQKVRPSGPPPAPRSQTGLGKGGSVAAAQKPGSWTAMVSTPPAAPPVASPYVPPPSAGATNTPPGRSSNSPSQPPAPPAPGPYASPAATSGHRPQQVLGPPPPPPRPTGQMMTSYAAAGGAYPYVAGGYMPTIARPQFRTLFRRDKAIVRSDWSFLFLMIIQPFVIGLLLFFLSDPNMFKDPTQLGLAQTVLFSLSVSAVYLGVLLAMRELVKERGIYRRERMVGLRLVPYFLSKISVLSLFTFYQSTVLLLLVLFRGNTPAGGALLGWAPLEMFITLFLTTFGGMSLGLLLSAMARTQEVLGALVPMVMIPQFLLSKIIIVSLPDPLIWISRLMFTSWSTEAMGDSVNLPNLVLNEADRAKFLPLDYKYEAGHLLLRWLMLITLSVSFLGLAWLRQKQRDNYQG